MNQSNATRAWEPSHNDLASTDEFPQTPEWLLDDVASGARTNNIDFGSDTIPAPPPDEASDAGPSTIPAPPPIGKMDD